MQAVLCQPPQQHRLSLLGSSHSQERERDNDRSTDRNWYQIGTRWNDSSETKLAVGRGPQNACFPCVQALHSYGHPSAWSFETFPVSAEAQDDSSMAATRRRRKRETAVRGAEGRGRPSPCPRSEGRGCGARAPASLPARAGAPPAEGARVRAGPARERSAVGAQRRRRRRHAATRPPLISGAGTKSRAAAAARERRLPLAVPGLRLASLRRVGSQPPAARPGARRIWGRKEGKKEGPFLWLCGCSPFPGNAKDYAYFCLPGSRVVGTDLGGPFQQHTDR